MSTIYISIYTRCCQETQKWLVEKNEYRTIKSLPVVPIISSQRGPLLLWMLLPWAKVTHWTLPSLTCRPLVLQLDYCAQKGRPASHKTKLASGCPALLKWQGWSFTDHFFNKQWANAEVLSNPTSVTENPHMQHICVGICKTRYWHCEIHLPRSSTRLGVRGPRMQFP